MHKYFENILKSFQIFQILMLGMNFRERSQKNQTSLAVRSGPRLFSEEDPFSSCVKKTTRVRR